MENTGILHRLLGPMIHEFLAFSSISLHSRLCIHSSHIILHNFYTFSYRFSLFLFFSSQLLLFSSNSCFLSLDNTEPYQISTPIAIRINEIFIGTNISLRQSILLIPETTRHISEFHVIVIQSDTFLLLISLLDRKISVLRNYGLNY